MGAVNGIKKEIVLNKREDFTVIVHACSGNYDADSHFQWLAADDPNSDAAHEILAHVRMTWDLS